MKKYYEIQDLDCANCALQLEKKINDKHIVDKVSINFLTCKICVEDENITKEKMDKIQKVCDKFEDGVSIVY